MYVGTKFIVRDTSTVAPIINDSTSANKPLYMSMFSSDRGPEKFTILEGSEWAKTYLQNNTPNFVKHGQPLLQATLSVDAGAKMFSKRLVADDALLASAAFAIGLSTREYEVPSYTKVAEGTAGAKKVVSTKHTIDPNTEIDIATLSSDFKEGDWVKSVTLTTKSSTGDTVVDETKQEPTQADRILVTAKNLYGTGKTDGQKAYRVGAIMVSASQIDATWTDFGTDTAAIQAMAASEVSSIVSSVAGAPSGVTIDNYDGTSTTNWGTITFDDLKNQFYKKVDVYVTEADHAAYTRWTAAAEAPGTTLNMETDVWPTPMPTGLIKLSEVQSRLATAIAGLSADEKGKEPMATAIATAESVAIGDRVAPTEVKYIADNNDDNTAKKAASTTHTVDPDTEVDIAAITNIVVALGDWVTVTTGIEKCVEVRPMLYSLKNDPGFYKNVTENKQLLYDRAVNDIKATLFSNDTYTKSVDEGGITLINGKNAGGADRKYRLYTDPSATMADGIVYPLFMVYDAGRGVSDKCITIEPNYSIAKSTGAMVYTLNTIDATTGSVLESKSFTLNVYATTTELKSTDIQTVVSGNSNLIDARAFFDVYDACIDKLAEYGVPSTIFSDYDMINKKAVSGKSMGKPAYTGKDGSVYVIATQQTTANPYGYPAEAYDYNYTIVNQLLNGSNGSLRSMNEDPSVFYNLMHEALTGKFSLDIYNLDLYAFDCIFDANYDNAQVKADIQKLAVYRGDCTCFMDMGTEVSSLQECKDMRAWDGTQAGKEGLATNPKYFYLNDSAVYVTSVYYDRKNPFDGRQITVTATMGLATNMVKHFINGFNRPFAGKLFNITFPEAIENTVNYIPKIYPITEFTPEDIANTYPSDSNTIMNEKQEMADIKVNYASYYSGVLTMDTLYTTYKKDSELSYVNNVITVQKIIKEIRNALPDITRYAFITSDTLVEFKGKIQNRVIDKYAAYFDELSFDYIVDPTYVENKIFYGALTVRFKAFTQSEIITVTVVNNSVLS